MSDYSHYKSCAAKLFELFAYYQKASGKWGSNSSYAENLHLFDKYCYETYPSATELTQGMIDGWCMKRTTETNDSCGSRISVVISCVKYLNSRNLVKLTPPIRPEHSSKTYIPHYFTEEELKDFFHNCDYIPLKHKKPSKASRLNQLVVPIFFRLLYSSGLRTIEARLLRIEDVDLETGVLSIRQSKGDDQHFVVLDDGMLEAMKVYDNAIRRENLSPNREYFFPNKYGKYHDREWVGHTFRRLWNSDKYGHAVPYDFRHNYATVNLNRWVTLGIEFNARFLQLSKSMGHVCIESTRYYYSLVPALADVMLNLCNKSFNEIIPEPNYEKNQTEQRCMPDLELHKQLAARIRAICKKQQSLYTEEL